MHQLILIIAGIVLLLPGVQTPCSAARLYVFFPSIVRPQIMQAKLAKECPGIDVTVFGSYKDFEASIAVSPPDVLIANSITIEHFNSFTVKLRGIVGGNFDEQYYMLTMKCDTCPVGSAIVNVGAVDFLGRAGMINFVELLSGRKLHVRTVVKVEDLLSLLRFNMAEAILAPARYLEEITSSSTIELLKTPLPPMRTGSPSVAVLEPEKAGNILNVISGMNASTRSLFGIDDWKNR